MWEVDTRQFHFDLAVQSFGTKEKKNGGIA